MPLVAIGMGHLYFDRDCIDYVDWLLGLYAHFNNIDSYNLRTWYIFSSVCIIFSISHQCLTVF